MNIIVGGTGQVGSATAQALLRRGELATVVTRNAAHAAALKAEGATIAEADIRDIERLRDLFGGATRAFLLNPPADPATDTDTEERANIAAIVHVLEGLPSKRSSSRPPMAHAPASAAAISQCSTNSSNSFQRYPFPSRSIVVRTT